PPEGDARPARAAVPRPDERDGRSEPQGDAGDGPPIRERSPGGRSAAAVEGGRASRRGGRRAHARARAWRVEAPGQEGRQARADGPGDAPLRPLAPAPAVVTTGA